MLFDVEEGDNLTLTRLTPVATLLGLFLPTRMTCKSVTVITFVSQASSTPRCQIQQTGTRAPRHVSWVGGVRPAVANLFYDFQFHLIRFTVVVIFCECSWNATKLN